jgi:hypothetical protein
MNSKLEQSAVITIGKRVRVKREQILLCGPRYPGRTGTVMAENEFGRSSGGLWYVRLDATQRARERVTTFFSSELEILVEDET